MKLSEKKRSVGEGIIAVANHKLRVEGVEAYKEQLEKEYYPAEDVKEAVKELKEKIPPELLDGVQRIDTHNRIDEVFGEELSEDSSHKKKYANE